MRWRWCALALGLALGCAPEAGSGRGRGRPPAPVAVAPIERGPIALTRVFGGTLEAPAKLVVAAKLTGRLERLAVDLGDAVRPGQVVAVLDDDELRQLAAQAQAALAVAEATAPEAKGAAALAEKELERLKILRGRGVISASQLDAAQADAQAKAAAVAVAEAEVTRARAALDAARIRVGYTQLAATWSGDGARVVAERFVDEGAMVAANEPILSLVALDPLTAVIHVAEKDYRYLQVGLRATLSTDAFPEVRFEAEVARVAPVFETGSRQARVELAVPNPERVLKPGLFVKARVELHAVADAVVVPQAALTTRDDQVGVFWVDEGKQVVAWAPVEVGIRDGERVQLVGFTRSGRVVTLGQQLLDDGAAITIPGPEPR